MVAANPSQVSPPSFSPPSALMMVSWSTSTAMTQAMTGAISIPFFRWAKIESETSTVNGER